MKTDRPWGYYEILSETSEFKIKFISVDSNKRLSYQRHQYRSEHWTIIEGIANIIIDGEETTLFPYQSISIPSGTLHRVKAGEYGLKFIEVQTGTYFGEDDIERIEDDYGR